MTEIRIHLLLFDGRHRTRSRAVRAPAQRVRRGHRPNLPCPGVAAGTALRSLSLRQVFWCATTWTGEHNEQAGRVRDRSSVRLRRAGPPTREVPMSWLLLALAVWLAVSLPLALVIVRTIHQADSE